MHRGGIYTAFITDKHQVPTQGEKPAVSFVNHDAYKKILNIIRGVDTAYQAGTIFSAVMQARNTTGLSDKKIALDVYLEQGHSIAHFEYARHIAQVSNDKVAAFFHLFIGSVRYYQDISMAGMELDESGTLNSNQQVRSEELPYYVHEIFSYYQEQCGFLAEDVKAATALWDLLEKSTVLVDVARWFKRFDYMQCDASWICSAPHVENKEAVNLRRADIAREKVARLAEYLCLNDGVFGNVEFRSLANGVT